MNQAASLNSQQHGQQDKEIVKSKIPSASFLLALLLVSAITASVAGYRVKMADRDRKVQLRMAYEHLGGSKDILLNMKEGAAAPGISGDQATFLAAYEINERARAFGLYPTLEESSPERVAAMISALAAIGASDHAKIVSDTWGEMRQDTNSAEGTGATSAKAMRISKHYTRRSARDVEAKLFYFLDKGSLKIHE